MTNQRDEDRQAQLRLTMLSELARALLDAHDVDHIFGALASTMTSTLCDGCVIDLSPINRRAIATQRLDRPAHGSTASLPLQSRQRTFGTLMATRDGASGAFDQDDLVAIQACIEYACGAAERVLGTSRFGQEMVGILSHDLRSPLAAIIIGTERLQQRSVDGGTHVMADQIVFFARRMSRMIDQLLDMTRLRVGGGLLLARCKVHLMPLVCSVLEDIGPANPSHRFELGCDADIVGHWDPDRLGQVIASLLRNAVQYGREGGAIEVRVEQVEGLVHLTVHNELRGPPIPDAATPGLFEPCHRGWDDDIVGNGLGLDLYIAREIVRKHGGVMSVESTTLGTSVRVSLPKHFVEAGANSPAIEPIGAIASA